MSHLTTPATGATDGREQLLTPGFMRQLDRLDLLTRKVLRGRTQGERRSRKRGQSVEFADYRNYVVGDDLRRIDWNLYARLDKLFLRLFLEEEDVSVSLALDITGSMDHGQPNKLFYARQLVAALGYVGLCHLDRVSLFSFTDTLSDEVSGLRSRQSVARMVAFLQRQRPRATADGTGRSPGNLDAVFKSLALRHRHPGVVIVISDFFDKGDLRHALRYLSSPAMDVYLLQVLSPQELDPVKGQVVGDLNLVDVEDADTTPISISQALLKRYQANLQAYCAMLRNQCVGRGMTYLMTSTDVPLETVMLHYLRQRGLVG